MNINQKKIRKLSTKAGLEVVFSDFGAAITSLKVPVSDTEKKDVVMGFDHLEDYQKSFELPGKPFLGAIVGLHAGRVNLGKYKNGSQEIQLEQNSGKHHLHGGSVNLSNQFWNLISQSDDELVYEIDANDHKTKIRTEYRVEDLTVKVLLTAKTEEDVLINLTQHSYFNLEGHQGDVRHLLMKVNADEVLETDTDLIPTGNMKKVQGTSFDFSHFEHCPAEIDTSFVLKDHKNPAAVLQNPENNLTLEVRTNQPSVHIFVGGAHCNPLKGKGETVYHKTSGICFEAQNFPDSPNHQKFKNGILKSGETYTNKIEFTFKTN